MQGQAYIAGANRACELLGVKEAGARSALLRVLKGSSGEMLMRVPVQALMGALAGGATGAMTDHARKGALIGAASGALGGVAVAGAPKLRAALIKALR